LKYLFYSFPLEWESKVLEILWLMIIIFLFFNCLGSLPSSFFLFYRNQWFFKYLHWNFACNSGQLKYIYFFNFYFYERWSLSILFFFIWSFIIWFISPSSWLSKSYDSNCGFGRLTWIDLICLYFNIKKNITLIFFHQTIFLLVIRVFSRPIKLIESYYINIHMI